jgi:ureidoglycolate lyase
MPPTTLDIASVGHVVVRAEQLTAEAFRPFGHVVVNPRPDVLPSTAFANGGSGGSSQPGPVLPFAAVSANQGSAIKYQHISPLSNLYARALSGRAGEAIMSMFVCEARRLATEKSVSAAVVTASPSPASGREGTAPGDSRDGGYFAVRILERHPFTTQTFIPLTADPSARYLVIVAPNAQHASAIVPSDAPQQPPQMQGLRAFIATGTQAVTYGAGTWHAPMVALGKPRQEAVAFVVVQFANGVGPEDCEEVTFTGGLVDISVPPLKVRANL